MGDLAATFDESWRELESAIRRSVANRGIEVSTDVSAQIDALAREGVISRDQASELHQLRQLRNTRTHNGIGRSVRALATPTPEAVELADWYVEHLHGAPRVARLMVKASTCHPDDPVLDVVGVMQSNDFDTIPYRGEDDTWYAFCRTQLVQWLALEAATRPDEHVTVLKTMTVNDVAGLTGARRPVRVSLRMHLTGARRPVRVSLRMHLTDAVKRLDELCRGHAHPHDATLLVAERSQDLLVMSPYGLPKALALLTPPV